MGMVDDYEAGLKHRLRSISTSDFRVSISRCDLNQFNSEYHYLHYILLSENVRPLGIPVVYDQGLHQLIGWPCQKQACHTWMTVVMLVWLILIHPDGKHFRALSNGVTKNVCESNDAAKVLVILLFNTFVDDDEGVSAVPAAAE